MAKVGYIGLGIMGGSIARNLMKAGHELVVVENHSRKVVEELVGNGAKVASSPKEVAEQVEFVFTNLPDTPDVRAVELDRVGPTVERHPAFPRRINAHWVQIHSPGEVTMRTWERGSGITLACGTGACAVCVGGVLTGRTGRNLLAHLPGGDLTLEWREADNCVYMTGPATEVFSGEWSA